MPTKRKKAPSADVLGNISNSEPGNSSLSRKVRRKTTGTNSAAEDQRMAQNDIGGNGDSDHDDAYDYGMLIAVGGRFFSKSSRCN